MTAFAPAVLQYIDHGAYPDSESVASTTLTSSDLSTLLTSLQQAQDEVKHEIRTLSKETAPDIDEWISRAKSLQADILRSRETARAIVAEHEAGKVLKAQVEDKAKQVQLLEKEVAFEEALAGTLEHIRYANGLLNSVQNDAVVGNLERALETLEQADESIGGLEAVRDTKAVGLLQARAQNLRESLVETCTECWNGLIQINSEDKKIKIQSQDAAAPDIQLDVVIMTAKKLDAFDGLVQKLAKDIERTIFRPRLLVDDESQIAKVEVEGDQLSCTLKSHDTSTSSLFNDLQRITNFLAAKLPVSVAVPLSESLMPVLASRLEEHWLEPAVPIDITHMPAFQKTLGDVGDLANVIDKHGWHGASKLRGWVQNAPRTWLTKRRETVLGDVRNLVFAGLRETKTVERVETQVVSKDDRAALGGGDGDDEWDAWGEAEEEQPTVAQTQTSAPAVAAEDDDGDAWNVGEPEIQPEATGDGEDEGAAWGWDDNVESTPNPPSPDIAKKATSQKAELNGDPTSQASTDQREITLRETFRVTAIPDNLLATLQQIITDAQALAAPEYAHSPIAPAATGLYTLPTLALAIYRATASTAYSKLPTGNMLIYNDALRLAELLRAWQASQPPASRLRLDGDVAALEAFAKRAYTAEMESQRTILRDLLDGAQGFSNCTKQPYKSECESAVADTVDRLREVRRQWTGTLSSGALLQSLGSLLSTITSKMITEIEELGDIGEEDSHELRRLIDTVTEAKDIFEQPRADGEVSDMTFIYCPNWLKFQYLAEILDASLADIKYLWNEGELSLEFEVEEVVELIEGLFADSEIRRRTVGEIRRGGRR